MNSGIDSQSSSLCHISVAVVIDTEKIKNKKNTHTSEEDDTIQSKAAAAAVRLAAAQ